MEGTKDLGKLINKLIDETFKIEQNKEIVGTNLNNQIEQY